MATGYRNLKNGFFCDAINEMIKNILFLKCTFVIDYKEADLQSTKFQNTLYVVKMAV